MPVAYRPDARIWWDQSQTGDPMLLITGHATGAGMWDRATPDLAASYRVIRFGNRGVGRSSDPPGPYSVRLTPDDALAVLGARPGEETQPEAPNDLDPQVLAIAPMWMADEEAPASRYQRFGD